MGNHVSYQHCSVTKETQSTPCDSITYAMAIHGGLRDGTAIVIRGTVFKDGKFFAVNLCTGEDDNDIVFHCNPRLGEKVVFNTFTEGSWGKEEYAADGIFNKGADFELAIIIRSQDYQVIVDDQLRHTYQHRKPVSEVETLKISGEVSIKDISYALGVTDAKHKNLCIPFKGPVPCNVNSRMTFAFKGSIPESAEQFAVNLKTGENDGDNIILHLNPRFGSKVVFNTHKDGAWGEEIYAPDKHFRRGHSFECVIVVDPDEYQVVVDSEKICSYKHRIPVEEVKTLQILGDVAMEFFAFSERLS